MLYQKFTIVIYTQRLSIDHGQNLQHLTYGHSIAERVGFVYDYLYEHNIPYHDIYLGKPQFDAIIDDRALTFRGSWDAIVDDLLRIFPTAFTTREQDGEDVVHDEEEI